MENQPKKRPVIIGIITSFLTIWLALNISDWIMG